MKDSLYILDRIKTVDGIEELLDLEDFSQVYTIADAVRRRNVGDVVHLRAIIEFSNVCSKRCMYCGLNCGNRAIRRFRMAAEEIIGTAAEAVAAGYRTIVLQSGEDSYFTKERVGDIVGGIKELVIPGTEGMEEAVRHPKVTLSIGERSTEEYAYWKEKGADRYLLKHETADPRLFRKLHPGDMLMSRVECLKALQRLGYETGSGFMVGLPGQTSETLAEDLLLLKTIPCQMAGIGPFIANPKTPLGGAPSGDVELSRRCVALARLLLPKANLPVTTSYNILKEEEEYSVAERERNVFSYGANVIMKKVTPDKYKGAYEIYPAEYSRTDIVRDRMDLIRDIEHFGRRPL